MVRTRGLGRALRRTIGKVLGRRDESDDDRQIVLEDPPTTKEELVNEQLKAPIEEGVTDIEGFLGGPHDTSVLSDFQNHIAFSVWNGELSSHGRKMAKFGRSAVEIEGLVVANGLNTADHGLMSAFVERWHKETSSFHLLVREVTITLPVVGAFHNFEQSRCWWSYSRSVLQMLELRPLTVTGLMCDYRDCATRAYLLHLLGCTLFADKSATHVHLVFLDALRDLTQSAGYAWGVAALVHMYDNLNDASKSTARQLAGYITLLQYLIYEHFRWTSGKALLVATYRRRLDRLTLDAVCWIPYGDHHSFREFEVISLFSGHLIWGPLTVIHRPERVVQQFGYIQTIPPHPAKLMIDECNLVSTLHLLVSGHCSPDYLGWFYVISHPFIYLPQPGDPLRVPSIQQYEEFVDAHMYQQPMAAAAPTEAHIDQHDFGHAVEDFAAIADRLNKLLNLRILTEGTLAYTVVEECVGIARRYTGQPTVADRSRRRRRTNG
ncbi:Protein MAIN-LIKE 1 [Glycine soja]